MSLGELAAFVQSQLREKGIDMILSGGASVAIYSNNRYVSNDLDFVDTYFTKGAVLRIAMEEIGFRQAGRHYTHPETDYFIDFPAGPLSVGSKPVSNIVELEYVTGVLKLISPTDCVKDRLSAFYHWGDRQGLAQAILVTQMKKVDIAEIKNWSQEEGKLEEFREFQKSMEK